MARRDVPQFEGEATLTDEKLEAFKNVFATAMGDEDKASDISDSSFYEGWAEAMKFVRESLYDPAMEKAVPMDAIVLDLDLHAHIGVTQLIADLRRDGYRDLADQIEAQIRRRSPSIG